MSTARFAWVLVVAALGCAGGRAEHADAGLAELPDASGLDGARLPLLSRRENRSTIWDRFPRGLFVRRDLLCQTFPRLPANVGVARARLAPLAVTRAGRIT